jgi:hypothetical protein
VPVGVALPLAPLTAAVTVKACVAVMLDEDGVRVMVGVVFTGVAKLAVTVVLEFRVTVQVLVLAEVHPVHEEKLFPAVVAGAVRVTVVPES